MKIISTDPSEDYQVIGEVQAATAHDVRAAVDRARTAQPAWAELTQDERNSAVKSFVEMCGRHDEEIAAAVSREMGKPIRSARDQVKESFDYFRAYMEMAEKALAPQVVFENEKEIHYLTREPLGVVACIAPWNFPFLNIPWQAGQALLAGNAVLYKPSEEIVIFAKLIRDLVEESDLPGGVFSVILGDGSVGEQMVMAPVDTVMFTGSTRTGRKIAGLTAKDSKRLITELGGSAAGIVFEDADVPCIIDTLYDMRFDNSGQYCDGLKRLLVHESKFEEVLQALEGVNAKRKVGKAMDESTDIGPLVARRQLDLLKEQVGDALDKGAKVRFGGKEPADLQGAYYEPTVLTDITPDMRVWQEEVFGPVLPVVTFKTDEDAVRLANDTIYGLGGFVFTEDKDRYRRVARQIQTGVIGQNNALFYNPYSPFGGYKASGTGRTNGVNGFHAVTQPKLICEEK